MQEQLPISGTVWGNNINVWGNNISCHKPTDSLLRCIFQTSVSIKMPCRLAAAEYSIVIPYFSHVSLLGLAISPFQTDSCRHISNSPFQSISCVHGIQRLRAAVPPSAALSIVHLLHFSDETCTTCLDGGALLRLLLPPCCACVGRPCVENEILKFLLTLPCPCSINYD